MRFEKVRREFFNRDSVAKGFTPTDEVYDSIKIPVRGTEGSAGYDFSTPYDIEIHPGEQMIIPTGIKAFMEKGEVLLMVVRSSVGIKERVRFSNSVAVIDQDFYGNEKNDGDIMLALENNSKNVVTYKAGTRLAQGLFFKFGTTENDNASGVRSGGIGSTNNG